MKKLLRLISCGLLAMFAVLAVVAVGGRSNKESVLDSTYAAETDDSIYVQILSIPATFTISEMQFTIDGAVVTYNSDGYKFDETTYFYSIDFQNHKKKYDLNPNNVQIQYFETDDFLNKIGASGYTDLGIETGRIPTDKGSNFILSISAELEKYYYISSMSYQIGLGAVYQIDTTSLTETGDVIFNKAEYNESEGYYSITINTNNKFNYKYDSGNYWFEVESIRASNNLFFESNQKSYGVVVNGTEGGTFDGRIDTGGYEKYTYSTPAEISFTPKSGEILDSIELYFGGELVITLYGGMQDGGRYQFNDEVSPSKKISYGYYALGYESGYSFTQVEADGSYAQLQVEKNGTKEDIESFVITLSDTGKIVIKTNKISKGVKLVVSVQKYVQLNLVEVEGSENKFTSEPYSSVQIGNGENPAIYTDDIPNHIFAIGFTDTVYIKVLRKDTYQFTKDVPLEFIGSEYGNEYINEYFAGGVLSVYAQQNDKISFSIRMTFNGEEFYGIETKIYISDREEVDDIGDFLDGSELSVQSGVGLATKHGITKGTNIKIYIKIGPFYMMNINGTYYSDYYFNASYTLTDSLNQILEIEVFKFSFEKPVTYNGEVIGTLRVNVNYANYRLDGNGNILLGDDGNFLYDASYDIAFKPIGGNYGRVTMTNPSVYGHNLVNMSVNGRDILTKYPDTTFGISSNDTEIHRYLASTVFYSPDNGIIASFTAKLKSFNFECDNKTFSANIYFGTTDLYLDRAVRISNPGKYFAGLYYYLNGEALTKEYLISQSEVPEVITEGPFAGMVKYTLSDIWSLDDASTEVYSIISNKSINIIFVFTTSEDDYEVVSGSVKFEDYFDVDMFNTESLPDPTIGTGFNLIGWEEQMDDAILFYESDTAYYSYHELFYCDWTGDVRFVPVFSRGIAIVSVFDQKGVYMDEIQVRFEDNIDVAKANLLKDELGGYKVCYQYGYTFLGFYDEKGNQVIAYDPTLDTTYDYKTAENPYYFDKNDLGSDIWIITENLNLYARLEAIGYAMDLFISNPSYRADSVIKAITGSQTEFVSNKLSDEHYEIQGFNITDDLNITGIGAKTDAFIAKIRIGSKIDESSEVVFGEPSFITVCNRAGELAYTNIDSRFNQDENILIIKVDDFISVLTGASQIVIEIEYLPVTYIISFTANIVDNNWKVIFEDASETVYYKLTKDTAYLSKVNEWQLCDENGNTTGEKGWLDISTRTTGITFVQNSLYGISGISYIANNGKEYSFKAWKDFINFIEITDCDSLAGAYDFVSMFSDDFDVTVEYYIYNDMGAGYYLHYKTGYFWSYDVDSGGYYIDNAITANSYEVYLISGAVHYISSWTTEELYSFTIEESGAEKIALNSNLSLVYNEDVFTIKLFALYKEFSYSVIDDGTNYNAVVNLPNDPNGNSYSASDVVWVKVSVYRYANYDETNLSVVDKLSAIFGTEDILEFIVGTGASLDKSKFTDSEYYLFAVIERKMDGAASKVLYIAKKVV